MNGRFSLRERARFKLGMFEYSAMPQPLRRALIRALAPDPFELRSTKKDLDQEVIFIHVPKTGGTSLATALGLMPGHVPASRFQAYDPVRFATAYSFAFVREPADRLYSSFNYLRTAIGLNRSRDVRWAETYLAPYNDFESFVLALKDKSVRQKIMAWPHFRPMCAWLCLPGSREPQVRFIGHFETLTADVETLCQELGLSFNLPHTRKPQTYLEKRFTTEMLEIISDLYRHDEDIFGYS